MKKNFAILLTYENEYKEDLTEKEVEEWIAHLLGLKYWNSVKVVSVKEYKPHDSLWTTHFLKQINEGNK